MRLLEDEVSDFGDHFNDLISALDDIDLSSLAGELETPAAIEDFLGDPVAFDEGNIKSALTGILDTENLSTLMEIYIAAAAEQFNFEVLNEILSGNFNYKQFVEQALVGCLTDSEIPSSLTNHPIGNAALREALDCGSTCTLGAVLGNLDDIGTGLGAAANDPGLLAGKAKELSGSVMTGIEKRIREIIMEKLMLLPYGEFVLHGYGAVSFFDHTETIYEMTGFIGTRLRPEGIPLDPSEYARLDGVKKRARDRFITAYDTSLEPFLPYYKFYAKGMVIGLADAIIDGTLAKAQTATGLDKLLGGTLSADDIRDIQASISRGEFDQELVSQLWAQYGDDLVGALEKGLGTTQEELVTLAKQAEEEGGLSFGEPEKNPNGAGDSREEWGDRYPLGELLYDDEYSLPVSPGLSVVLQWGVSLSTEVYLKEYADYGLVEKEGEAGGRRLGLTAGLGLTPTVRSDGYLSAGLGIDLEVLEISISLEGHIMFVWFAAPFRMQMLLGPEFGNGDLTAKLYLTASLSPRLTLFDADLRLKVQVVLAGIIPITYRTTIADFKPLIDRDYGNLLPIPPLSLDLFSLGQIMNGMK